MLKSASYLLILLVFNQQLFASCGEEAELKSKIQQLKLEVACSTADSLHLCQQLLKDFRPIGDVAPAGEAPPESCNAAVITTYPISVAARTLAKHVNEVVSIKPKLVNSVEEFYEHTRLHRERVKALGLELLKSHPELFDGLTPAKLKAILEAHDLAKVTASSVGPDGRPFYQTLYQDGYGKRLDRATVDALNSKDKMLMEKAINKHGLTDSPELRAKIERIEKIADLVDRGMSPVSSEEFGRPMDKASAFLKNEEDQKLARELEKKYKTVTQKLSYRGLTPIAHQAMSNHLLLEERFAVTKSSTEPGKLSARLMAHTLMSKGNSFFARALELLASKGVSRALMVLDFPMLFFADMDNLGCAGLGYHDWVKTPNCQPAIGLTPKVVAFLDENWETQRIHLDSGDATCRVIKETYAQSITTPKIKSCGNKEIEMELKGGDNFKVKLDGLGRMKEIELQDLSRYTGTFGIGRAQRVMVGPNGQVEKVCFEKDVRGTKSKKCVSTQSPALAKSQELISTINYQIQKGIERFHQTCGSASAQYF